ncbi:unnamed protein product, partial [Nippostrongylus brasiliensis]|uniref:Myosin heavy chain n=1 Tax=Nippostrongylus brasiliensis TaxID=27835 RepID=A0A0N4YYA8_NIPBR
MNEGRERSDALAADNGRLAEKLKELGEEYESRMNAIQAQVNANFKKVETDAYKWKQKYE